jgi:hypothetical protein
MADTGDMLQYDPGHMSDYIMQVHTFSAEVDGVRAACAHIVNQLRAGHFTGSNAQALDEVWASISSAIDEVQQTIRLHGDRVDGALTQMIATDIAGASSLLSF